MIKLIAASAILGFCQAQDPTVADILLKMEKALHEARGTTFQLRRPNTTEAYGVYKVSSDGSVAITYGGHVAKSLTPEGVYIAGADYFPTEFYTLERSPIGGVSPPNFLRSQPEGWVFQALAPDRTLPFGQELKTEGRRTVEGEEYFVLSARFPAFVPINRNAPFGASCGTGRHYHKEDRVRWGISTRDFRLKWLEERSVHDPAGADSHRRIQFLEWKGGVPSRLVLNGWRESEAGDFKDEYELCSFKSGLDIPPDVVRPPRGELFATRGWDPSVGKDLERSPEDPDLLYSAALYYLRTTPGNRSSPPPFGPAISNLEKALAKQWGDGPAGMLLVLYDPKADAKSLESLMARIEKRSELSVNLRKAAGKILIKTGRAERALNLLPKCDPAPPSVFNERLDALEAAGKRDLALDELAAVNPDAAREWSYLFATFLRTDAKGVPESVDQAIVRHPGSPILRDLALRLASAQKDPVRYLKLAGSTVPKKFGGWVDRQILEILGYWLSRPYRESNLQLAAERIQALKSELLSVLKGLDAQPKSPPLQAAVHLICDDRESARKALEEAIARAPKWESYDQMQQTCVILLSELERFGDEALFERGLKASLDQLKRLPYPFLIPNRALGNYMKRRVENGSAGRLFHDFKGYLFSFSRSSSDSILGAEVEYHVGQRAAASIIEEARKNPADGPGNKWLAQTIERESSKWQGPRGIVGALEFHLKALEVDPDDVECLDRAGHFFRAKRDYAGARRCAERLLRLIENDKGNALVPSADQIRIRLAELDVVQGHTLEGEKRLRGISWDSPHLKPSQVWLGAELWADLGNPEEAHALFRELLARGYRPYLRMAELYGSLKNRVEQVRYLNRALTDGYDLGPPHPGREYTPWLRPPSAALEKMKKEIREQAGPEAFVKAFLALKHAPVPADVETRARKCIALLASDDIADREAAAAELLNLGPIVAPLLAPAYHSERATLRAAAGAILDRWAEPR